MNTTSYPFDLALAVNLNNLRNKVGLLQKEAAAGIGVVPQVYGQLKKGTYHFTDEIIDVICVFFKVHREGFVKVNDKINMNNSPNSANYNSQTQVNTDEVIKGLMEEVECTRAELSEELKSTREKRKAFMNLIKTLQK